MAFLLSTLFLTTQPLLASENKASWKELFNENNILVESKEVEGGVIPFRASTTIKAPIETVSQALEDLENKNKWAPKLKSVKVHARKGKNEYLFSEYYKTPWPASDREFLLRGSVIRESEKKVLFSAKSELNENLADDRHVQSHVTLLQVSLTAASPNQTNIEFTFIGHFGGWIPTWISNLIQRKWPYKFLLNLKEYIATGQIKN